MKKEKKTKKEKIEIEIKKKYYIKRKYNKKVITKNKESVFPMICQRVWTMY